MQQVDAMPHLDSGVIQFPFAGMPTSAHGPHPTHGTHMVTRVITPYSPGFSCLKGSGATTLVVKASSKDSNLTMDKSVFASPIHPKSADIKRHDSHSSDTEYRMCDLTTSLSTAQTHDEPTAEHIFSYATGVCLPATSIKKA